MKHDLPSFAVLIDADNVRQETISPILEEITRHAWITVRRIYGDFTSQSLAGWKNTLAQHAIQPIQQYRNTVGKNASDSALIIDAMDLLHSRRFEGFCLVSSDSDFTRLCTRIREDGLIVFGFGEKKAPKSFVNACDRYIYVENLLGTSRESQETHAPANGEASRPAGAEVAAGAPSTLTPEANAAGPQEDRGPSTNNVGQAFRPPALAVEMLERAHRNVADDQGWAMLGQLSSYIHANHPDFDPRNYGCAKFIDLIQKCGVFELVNRPHKNGTSYFCRVKGAGQVRPISNGGQKNNVQRSFQDALTEAVRQATSANGWAPIAVIGQKLKALGHGVKESAQKTLSESLKASSKFDMKGSGVAQYFRVKPAAR